MKTLTRWVCLARAAAHRRIRTLARDESGAISPLIVLAIVPLLGAFGMATEASNWYLLQRGMQNAADSAVIAAATNAGTATATSCASTPSTFDCEAKAVAAGYGFTDGSNNVSVTTSCTATTATGSCAVGTCPGGVSECYSVAIRKTLPLNLLGVVGYRGDTTIGSAPAKLILANAKAAEATGPASLCLLALATNGETPGILGHGVPDANFNGCNIFSNTDVSCTGHNMLAGYAISAGTTSVCGVHQISNAAKVTDPYSGLAANIPADPCAGSYPQEPGKKGTALPSTNTPSGTKTYGATQTFCGDVQLAGNLTITSASPGTVVVIYNGQLDTNGFTFAGAAGSNITLIFAGSNGTYTHAPTGGGTLNISGPTSGNWSGVAVYQAPTLTTGVNISAAGNSPTWDIQGLIYLPNSDVLFSGAVNKSTNGLSCFVLVVNTVQVNGTGDIFQEGQCAQAGLNMPQSQTPGPVRLVA